LAGAYKPWNVRQPRATYGRIGYGECPIPFVVDDGVLMLDVDDEICGQWLYVAQLIRHTL